jgi:hypothetical protein
MYLDHLRIRTFATIGPSREKSVARETKGAKMRPLLVLYTTGLLSIGASACGAASHTASSTTAASTTTTVSSKSTQDYTKSDRDKDNDGIHASFDSDNNSSVLDFGHEANASEKRTITALVKHYYAAAAAEDGAKACSMIYSTFAEAIPEDYGTSPPGPSFARGTTCPAVMTKVFKHFHNQVAIKFAKLDVSRVRTKERQGLAILRFGTLPEREIRVTREGHTWKIEALLDSELP